MSNYFTRYLMGMTRDMCNPTVRRICTCVDNIAICGTLITAAVVLCKLYTATIKCGTESESSGKVFDAKFNTKEDKTKDNKENTEEKDK